MDTDDDDSYVSDRRSDILRSDRLTDEGSVPVYAQIDTYPCSTCGRSFNAESLVTDTRSDADLYLCFLHP